jgi:hypothetical protein
MSYLFTICELTNISRPLWSSRDCENSAKSTGTVTGGETAENKIEHTPQSYIHTLTISLYYNPTSVVTNYIRIS